MSRANENFIEGGKTSGGMKEGVIDPFPNPENCPEIGQISPVASSLTQENYYDIR